MGPVVVVVKDLRGSEMRLFCGYYRDSIRHLGRSNRIGRIRLDPIVFQCFQ